MDKLRSIIREELKVIINSDKPSEQVDFGPALGSAIKALVDIQEVLTAQKSESEQLAAINQIINDFF
ncbi:hypothetical protein G5B10_07710 [Fluviicola sp. SGL-29]|nr:hypothetical protein [Fluviicola sp. SGL-29]